MFGSLSPHKQLQSPKGENARPIEEIRRIRSGLSTSPRGLASPSKQGKKIEETGNVQIEISQDDHSDRPRFPIRIPVEQMKPKRNYLAQVRKSETTLETRPSTAKQSKTDINEKPRRATETSKGRSQKGPQSLNKRASIPKSEQMKKAGINENAAVDAKDLKRIIENIVDYKFRTYAGASNRALETQKSASNLSMDMSMRKRPNSSRRPLSSRTSNKKKAKMTESNRASSKKERRETEYSKMSQIPQEPIDPEEAKKQQLLRTKKIVIENLKKFSKEQKEKEEKKAEEDKGKTLKREEIRKLNKKIRIKNERSPDVQKSLSPVKHKYEWGVDQPRLEMKPERKQSGKKWEKKDPEMRRQEIGLAHLNNLEDLALRKAKIESKEKAAKIIKEAEDKYKIKRKEKTEEEKEKLKLLIREQIEKKRKAKQEEKAKTLQEKETKKKKLEALLKSVAEIQAKDLAEKREAEKNKPKPVAKKKSKRTIEESASSQPNEEDISNTGNRGRVQNKRQASESKRKQEEEEHEYEEEIFEEEVAEARELNEEDLYMLDELFEKIDILIESKLQKAGFSKLKAYCFSEQMNRKVEQERARIQQQQQRQKEQQLQIKQQQQQQQQNQTQTQQAGKGKSNVTFNNSSIKEKIEVEKTSSQKQKVVESEKRKKAFEPVDDYEIEEEQQEVYITKPLKESNNYSRALPPKQSIVEKGKQKSDTTSKKLEFRDDREQMQEGTGYRIYNAKSAEKVKSSMKENKRGEEGNMPEGVDFDEMLFNLTSEELIKLPYFSIVK